MARTQKTRTVVIGSLRISDLAQAGCEAAISGRMQGMRLFQLLLANPLRRDICEIMAKLR